MLPVKYSSKLGIYDNINIHHNTIRVRVVDHPDVLSMALSELQSEIGNPTVVGLGFDDGAFSLHFPTTIICGAKYCLIIQFIHMELNREVPQCFKDFLANQEICFVGRKMGKLVSLLDGIEVKFRGDVELDHLVAKFLKKPSLLRYNIPKEVAMATMAAEVGVALDHDNLQNGDYSSTYLDYDAVAFSDEGIKMLVSDVYASYLIGSKVLGSL